MFKIIQWTLVITMLATCAGCSAEASEAEALAEVSVYQAVIEDLNMKVPGLELLVIMDQTNIDMMPDDGPRRMLQYIKENLGGAVDRSTLEDFLAKNYHPQSLRGKLRLNVPVEYLSAADRRLMFSQEGGWQRFYETYPHSQGMITLSRVGFNPKTNQAIVYIGHAGGEMEGIGYYVFLTWDGSGWQVQERVMAWIV
jgi:hypothetical protein